MPPRPSPLVFLIAGEPSGDAIGARLMAALRREHGSSLRFTGVGGERMAAMGFRSLFPMEDISVMGFAELVPALPRLAVRLRQTVAEARKAAPDVVVGIDAKAFSLRVLGALSADRQRNDEPLKAASQGSQHLCSTWHHPRGPFATPHDELPSCLGLSMNCLRCFPSSHRSLRLQACIALLLVIRRWILTPTPTQTGSRPQQPHHSGRALGGAQVVTVPTAR